MSDPNDPTITAPPLPKKPTRPRKQKDQWGHERQTGIRWRSVDRYSIVLELDAEEDRETGKPKRVQEWRTFRADPALSLAEQDKAAHKTRRDLIASQEDGTFVKQSDTTVMKWLRHWLDTVIKPERRPATFRLYASIVEGHVATSRIANKPLQQLRKSDLRRYLAELHPLMRQKGRHARPRGPLAKGSVRLHQAVLTSALTAAVEDRLLSVTPAAHLRTRKDSTKELATRAQRVAREHCWTAAEAQRFLAASATASPQTAAFMYLALDSGARKSELHGLRWTDLDLEAATVTIEWQLDKAGVTPEFGPTKNNTVRTIDLGPETIAMLRVHKAAQAELKMRNRTVYRDFGLVFAKEHEDLQTADAELGQPLKTLLGTRYEQLIVQAGVRRIRPHGLRHTVATLLLQQRNPPHEVAARMGHSVQILLTTYAHALPGEGRKLAHALAGVLHGSAARGRA